jgi:hypothetical protein
MEHFERKMLESDRVSISGLADLCLACILLTTVALSVSKPDPPRVFLQSLRQAVNRHLNRRLFAASFRFFRLRCKRIDLIIGDEEKKQELDQGTNRIMKLFLSFELQLA